MFRGTTVLASALGALIITSLAPSPVLADAPSEPVQLPVGTCINMGNSLEPPQESAWGGEPIVAEDFTRIKEAGFETIRLPVRWDNKSQSSPPYTIDPAWMDRVALAVDQALAAGLNVILDSHHFEPIHEDPAGVAQWHGGVWKQIAARFAKYPEDKLWFELENEPHKNFTNENLIATLEPAYKAVRAINPTRPVIYGGGNWSGIDSLETLPMPDDANVYPTFHYYEPFDYTHQGAEWTAPNIPPPGRRFGTEADKERLRTDVAKIDAYVARTGKLPFMGETGAFDRHSPTEERAAYHRAITEAFGPTGMGICMWAYANTFPFYDTKSGQWLPGMRAAIGLDEPDAPPVAGPLAIAPNPLDSKPPKGRKLPKGLEGLDDALPGFLVNDPASLGWTTYGDRLGSKPIVDPAIPGGGAAMQLSTSGSGYIYDAGAIIPLVADIEKGRRYTVGFWARSVGSNAGKVGVRFQRNAAPYPGFGDQTVTIGNDWKFYEVTAVADQDVRRTEAIALFQLGAQKQVVEIGQTIVIVGVPSIVN